MKDIKNFNNYKLAKEALIVFNEALAILDVTYNSLNRFNNYQVIKNMCSELKVNKEILNMSIDKVNKIIDNKGEQ